MAGIGYAQSGTPQLGTLGIGFEPQNSPGRQLIFAQAVIAASQSATNQPQGLMGTRIVVHVEGVSPGASATITITGTSPSGSPVSETTTAISQSTANANGVYEYTTVASFASINASGITASSITSNALTNALLTCYGIVAAKLLTPAVALFQEEYADFSPKDFRGLLDEDVRMIQLNRKVTVDIKAAVYPESCEWIAPACIGNVTNPATRASLPATPTSLHASASFTTLGSPFTLTTQPTAPAQLLQFVIAGNALAGTLTITGTNALNEAISEVVSVTLGTPNGTFYSQNAYASVTNIAVSGFTAAATLTVQGVFAYNPIYNPTNQLATLAAEWYSGLESSAIPWNVFETFELDYDAEKELTLTLKGMAQAKYTIGDRTPTNLTATRFSTYNQPTDFPIPGWGALFYLDPINGTLGTTQWLDVLTMKIKGTTGQTPYYTSTGTQEFNRVGRKPRKMEVDIEIDFTNVILYDAYKAFQKQQLLCKFQSKQAYLGNNGGTPLYKTLLMTMYPHITKFELDPKDEHVVGKITAVVEYEPSVGYGFQMSFINQNNPNYLS